MTDRLLIAVGVNTDGAVWTDHFGMAPRYYLYDQKGILLEKRENPFGTHQANAKHHGEPGKIAELLNDCAIFIGQQMGQPKKLQKIGIKIMITTENEPLTAVQGFLKSM
jgi:predicted Fe-Mo cluster-binding NifX family protein